MFAASCTEDVPTLALLADKVNPVFQNLFTFGICAQFFRRTSVHFRHFTPPRRGIDAPGRVCYINNSIFAFEGGAP
jgi:hypothetical protein